MNHPDPHVRLVTSIQVGLVAAAAFGALAALFPGARMELRADAADDSDTALTYARLVLAENPSDAGAREAYVRRLARLGRFGDALAALEALERRGTPGDSASLLGLRIAHERAIATAPDTRARAVARADVDRRMRALVHARLSREDLEGVVEIGRAHGIGGAVAEVLESQGRLADESELLLRSADAYLAAGNPGHAAELRLETLDSLPAEAAVAVSLVALDELRAAGWPELAIATLDELTDRFAADPRIWASAIDVALANGDARRAADLGRARLFHVERTTSLLDEQIDLELAADSPLGALPFALERAKNSPDDRRALETAVRIAAWSGRPQAAYSYQHQLAFVFGIPEHVAALEGLASSVGDYETVLALRLRAGPPRALGAALELAEIYELVGQPEAAHSLLADPVFDDVDVATRLRALAALETRMGDFAAATRTYEALDARAELDGDEVLAYVDLLTRLGRDEAAMERLVRDDAKSGEDRMARMHALGEIAYASDRQDLVVTAYRPLYDASALDPVELERLWVSRRILGDVDGAFETALEAYLRTRSPRALISAGYFAIESDDGDRLERVLGSVSGDTSELEASPSYWALRVESHRRRFVASLAQEELAAARTSIVAAKRELEEAKRILGSLDAHPTLGDVVASVSRWDGDLERVALAVQARTLVASVDPSALERGYSFEREGQGVAALNVSLRAMESGSGDEEREALARQVEWLASERPRYVDTQAVARTLGDVYEFGGVAGVAYSGERITGLTSAGIRELGGAEADGVLASQVREIDATAGMRVRDAHGRTQITASLLSRDASLLPGATLSHERRILDRAEVSGMATVNTTTQETPMLRMYGARDAIAGRITAELPRRFLVGTGAMAERYVDLNRSLVARGLTVDASLGYRILDDARSLNVRLLGIAAPRSNERLPERSFDLRGAGFVGVAATLAKGDLRSGAPYAASLYYFVEIASGMIVPLNELGYRAYAGIGIPRVGSGQLRIAADISNVTGAAPGQMRAGLSLAYTYGLW